MARLVYPGLHFPFGVPAWHQAFSGTRQIIELIIILVAELVTIFSSIFISYPGVSEVD